jgi:uncharacterized protein
MNSRTHDPVQLDVEAFANDAAEFEGEWPASEFERLRDAMHADAAGEAAQPIRWRARGERRTVRGEPAQIWLHLQASVDAGLECQRCLQLVRTRVEVDRSLRFVAGEDTAAALDADSDEDVLALNRALDLRELIEDELLLALPLVPRHESCPQPLRVPDSVEALEDDAPHPFAALAALKGGTQPN